ncbi:MULTISPECIES: lysine-2,3-aminomutase-like protein [Rhizobium]|uniref:Lysine-2,3-aminomutase-like protein n=1 Tax=Rhizobium wuzhouense TaxID=1986026 RepID=A0ABX5NRC5_9HYPH|nr:MULTISPECIES: lysine-2,3-aminomutase-like protein [Rhizobium]PYB70474.1 lysine-2,3-aminomutase-like protein [Rhizobium wuzhouense]RKE77611.1 lysine 2,3-aminomutase [Rhizobium sp. AG855]
MADATLRTVEDLVSAGLVKPGPAKALDAVTERYAIALTPTVARLIDTSDPLDPIAAQYLPTAAELIEHPDERPDPIGDHPHSPVDGIVHRYPDRVLLKLLHVCPVYCRFCFRREMVGPDGDGTLSSQQLDTALDYIRSHDGIWEVILTGGDPLILSPRRLRDVMQALATIDHVKIVRIHSRVPAVDPARITPELVEALKSGGKTVFVALHANHPRELTPEVRAACTRLVDAGISMVSQSVLLKGINDHADTLAALMRAFVEMRVKPYYLHHPDMAPGTGHFRLTIAEGQAIMRELRNRISGLCIPQYILDLPDGHGKVEAGASALRQVEPNRYIIVDRHGDERSYQE